MRRMARLRRPIRVSGMTAKSRRVSSAESPRGGEGEVRGRSSRSQGLRSTISMRIKKRKKEDTQAMRAPMVTEEGSLPERPGRFKVSIFCRSSETLLGFFLGIPC